MLTVQDIPFAVEKYSTVGTVNNKEISRIFGTKNNRKITAIKFPVVEEMKERNIMTANRGVDLGILFEVHGIDIVELRKRMGKGVRKC